MLFKSRSSFFLLYFSIKDAAFLAEAIASSYFPCNSKDIIRFLCRFGSDGFKATALKKYREASLKFPVIAKVFPIFMIIGNFGLEASS